MSNLVNFYQKYIVNDFELHFKEILEEYKMEDPEEYAMYIGGNEQIKLRYYGIQYEIWFPFELNSPKISVIADMLRNGSYIGYYKEYYLLNGEFFDSDFVLE